MIDFSEKDLEREVAELCMAEQNILDRRLAQIPSRKLSPEFDRKMNRLFFLRKIRYDIFSIRSAKEWRLSLYVSLLQAQRLS